MLSNVDLVNSIRMLSLAIHTSHWLSFVPLTSNADGLVKAELRCRISPLWNEGYTAIFMVLLANKVPLSLPLSYRWDLVCSLLQMPLISIVKQTVL